MFVASKKTVRCSHNVVPDIGHVCVQCRRIENQTNKPSGVQVHFLRVSRTKWHQLKGRADKTTRSYEDSITAVITACHVRLNLLAGIFWSLFPLSCSVLEPLRSVTEDIYEVQTTTLVDVRDAIDEYLEIVSAL